MEKKESIQRDLFDEPFHENAPKTVYVAIHHHTRQTWIILIVEFKLEVLP